MQLVGVNKSENTGITSVDRSTKATLSTYNTGIRVKSSAKDLPRPMFEIAISHNYL